MAPNRSKSINPRKAGSRRFSLLLFIGVIFTVLVFFFIRTKSSSLAEPNSNTSLYSASAKEESKALMEAIQKEVDANSNYIVGVSVADLTNGAKATLQGDRAFRAASTTKVLVATLFLSKVQEGSMHLTDRLGSATAEYQLQQMVNQSNNDSWGLINDILTYPAEEVYAKKLGLNSYKGEENYFSPNDMVTFLSKLYKNELLNKQNTALILSYMQNTNDETLIPPVVVDKDDVKFYHKHGVLEDDLHDAAIIDNGKRPFVIAIYSNGQGFYQYDLRAEMMQKITKNVLKVIAAQ